MPSSSLESPCHSVYLFTAMIGTQMCSSYETLKLHHIISWNQERKLHRILVIYFCLANNPKTLRLETTKPKKNKQTIILHFPRVRYLGEAWKWKWSSSIVSDSLWPHGHQAPPCMGFSRQEYWSGLPLPSPGNFPTRDRTQDSRIVDRHFIVWATRGEA